MMAERKGFEPLTPQGGVPLFESGAFNHSAISPCGEEYKRNRFAIVCGGEAGIRTLEELASLMVFKTIAFDHSATSPNSCSARAQV